MTERLYFADSYTTRFDGEIVRRVETPEGPAVVLAATYFYPRSGGQPQDQGTIDGERVTNVIEQDGEVLHVLACAPVRERVVCHIDAGRRVDHMQQHNGQHILSGAFLREAGVQTLAFHLGTSTSTIDLDRPVLEPPMLDRVQDLANEIVRQARPVQSYFVTAEEASQLELRKTPEVEGILRVVDVEDFDRQACCGTHPRSTAEVGPILVRRLERFRKGTRVEFVCGERAVRDYAASMSRIRTLTQILSSSEAELVDATTRLVDEKKTLAKALQAYREQALREQALGWVREAETVRDLQLVVREIPQVTPAELRMMALTFVLEPGRVALLGASADGRAHLVFARSQDVGLDVAGLLESTLALIEGRGGGTPQVAQGGGPRVGGLRTALERARQTLLFP